MMAVVTIAIAIQGNLFAVVILGSVYSFLMATALVALDAVDVAMTEASVGAGIEFDSSAFDNWITRWRAVARYKFGHELTGWSVGLAISF